MNVILRSTALAAVLVGSGAFGFFWRDIQRGAPPSISVLAKAVGVKVPANKMSGEQVFHQNYQRILNSYVKPVKSSELEYAGIGGMMASLGDPHTIFLPPKAAQAFSDETRANFFGVGARLSPDPLGAKVANVFEDGPAFAAGMRKGDIITGVNGVTMVGKDIDSVVDKIKGPEGTFVKLTLLQPGKEKPLVVSIRRARITTPTVEGQVIAGEKIGYLTVSQFSEPTAAQFDRELAKVETSGIKGLVIDLRGNPGGLLETATEMLSRFLDSKVVVKMRFRNGDEEVARTSSGQVHRFDYPVAVLIDQDSASAAEIFSGCLHDYAKATLVGTQSYGKASVQNVFPLIDNSSAKITIARYYLPSSGFIGRKLDDDGVKVSGGLAPDVKVELRDDTQITAGDPKSDSQLAKAIEVLKSRSGI